MKTAGIISEYNPLHLGHKYHMDKTRQLTDCDYLVVVMSGDFCQRGTPAFFDKMTRARAALLAGADLVIELPSVYATSSAEVFAFGGISILDAIGVDHLSFGAKSDDVAELKAILDTLDSSTDLKKQISDGYKKGLTYARIISDISGSKDLNDPNNILGLEYLKAIKHLNSSMIPISIKRLGDYNSELISQKPNEFSSARALRKAIVENGIAACQKDIPDNLFDLYASSIHHFGPLEENDFSLELLYALNMGRSEGYESYMGIDRSLSDRIKNNLDAFTDYREFISLIKTRNLTYSHVARSLLHILLGIKNNKCDSSSLLIPVPYIRVLGFKESAVPLLGNIKKNSPLPIICTAEDSKMLGEDGLKMLKKDLLCSSLYNSKIKQKYGETIPMDFASPVLKL